MEEAPAVVAGLDEAGAGPAFGSLWAATVVKRDGEAWPVGFFFNYGDFRATPDTRPDVARV